jgi:hypothetical protein
MIRIAILDDYQNVSLTMADWSPPNGRAAIAVFNDHLSDSEAIVERLLPSTWSASFGSVLRCHGQSSSGCRN